MLIALAVFAAQFVYVLLLGLQSLCVNHGHYRAAAFNSFMLGSFGFFLTQQIAAAKGAETNWFVYAAFVVSGPLGITSSMWLHRHVTITRVKREKAQSRVQKDSRPDAGHAL